MEVVRNRDIGDPYDRECDYADRLDDRVAELEAALGFYADPKNWKEHETGIGMIPCDAMDYGSRAQSALNK